MMTAFYSYGNGEISIDDDPMWNTLDSEEIIPMINDLIKPKLKIKVSKTFDKFPTTLWFEMENLY